MEYFMAGGFLLLCFLTLLLHVISMPANWVLLGLALFWKLIHPMDAGFWYFLALGLLALTGEIFEHLAQVFGSRRYGGTSKGTIGAFVGTFAGAILGAPFFFGLGAIPGAVFGAYAGSLGLELVQKRTMAESHRAAMGNLYGRVMGMVVKAGLGMFMFIIIARKVWPEG